jgi:hypothetical protein
VSQFSTANKSTVCNSVCVGHSVKSGDKRWLVKPSNAVVLRVTITGAYQ